MLGQGRSVGLTLEQLLIWMQSTCRPTVYTEDLYTWPTQAHSKDDCGFKLTNTVVLAILGFLSAVRPKVDVRNHLFNIVNPTYTN